MEEAIVSVDRAVSGELDESAAFLHSPPAFVDMLPVAIYACDADGRLQWFNGRAADLWGRTPEIGEDVERLSESYKLFRLNGTLIRREETPLAQVLRTGRALSGSETSIERPDGTRVVAMVHIDPIKDDAGTVIGAVNCFHDVTEVTRADRKLRESEHQFRELLEALPAAIYTTDAAGRITFYNQAAVELSGRRPRLGDDEWCVTWRLYQPDGTPLPHDQCPMAVALREDRPIRGVEAVAERPDGTRVPFLPYPTPLHDASGALTGAVNMLVDLSDRKLAEHHSQILGAIVESSDDAIISKDLNGIIATWNRGAQRLFGYRPDEIIGKSITTLIPSDRHDEEPAIIERLKRGERIEHYETVRRRKDGSLVEISLTVSPVKNAEGRIIGASKIARDITERRRAEEQQILLFREMSHRVKNLFAVASAVATLSARSARTTGEMAKAIRDRLGALTRAHELTRPGLIDPGEKVAQNTTLSALLATIFAPYLDPEDSQDQGRIVANGPDVPIGPNAVTNFALVLHELATNAAKYGALSCSEGSVRIDWSGMGKNELLLTWTERGGPPVAGKPACEGFGSLLTNKIVRGQFGGQIAHDWQPEGLTLRLSMPLERIAT